MLYACDEALRVLASYDLSDAPAPRDQGTRDLTLVCNSLGDAGAIRDQILAENNR